jgi:hypothetical protein
MNITYIQQGIGYFLQICVPDAASFSTFPPSLLELPWPSLHPPAPAIPFHVDDTKLVIIFTGKCNVNKKKIQYLAAA